MSVKFNTTSGPQFFHGLFSKSTPPTFLGMSSCRISTASFIVATVIFLMFVTWMVAQSYPPDYDKGALGLAFALRRVQQTGSFLHITAHPDDEDNPLLVMLGRGRGIRTGLLTLTRGAGGQNEIGPELFEALAVLRTGELMSLHRYDNAEQFFTRAYDFGYSFSVQETLRRWGKEEILSDIVRVIRIFRPDVITTLPRFGEGGGQHHQASALLAAEAFRAAANPERFPDQLNKGLRIWQASKLYERRFWGDSIQPDERQIGSNLVIQTDTFDPLLGATYSEVGMRARSLHRCQGMPQLQNLKGQLRSYWHLIDSTVPVSLNESDFFDGIDTSLMGIEHHLRQTGAPVSFLNQSLKDIQRRLESAFDLFHPSTPEKTGRELAIALRKLRSLRLRIEESYLTDEEKYQLIFLLDAEEEDLMEALCLARQLRLEASVMDGLVEPGQSFKLQVYFTNGSGEPVGIRSLMPVTPPGWDVEALKDRDEVVAGRSVLKRVFKITVSPEADLTSFHWTRDPGMDRYSMDRSEHRSPLQSLSEVFVRMICEVDGTRLTIRQPAYFHYEGPWVGGEQYHGLMVVPTVSVAVQPDSIAIPLNQVRQGRDIRVSTTYQGKFPRSGEVKLEVPSGWKVSPDRIELLFQREGQTVNHTFRLMPTGNVHPGKFSVRALISLDGVTYGKGYQSIDYHHIQKKHLLRSSQTTVNVIGVQVSEGVKIGYIEGVGDRIPDALEQLGVDFQLLSDEDLAFVDLSSYDVIMTGVRAYLAREQLRVHNQRLLNWVRDGGTMVVQYNKFEFNRMLETEGKRKMSYSLYAPYPVQVGRGRITDETAKVNILAPMHPVLNFPNTITLQDWVGWVQERGLYFLEKKDIRYQDLVAMEDPFVYNKGEKTGALVVAEYGHGKWVYIGLALWRQLPAGVSGAYRLLANLVSLGSRD